MKQQNIKWTVEAFLFSGRPNPQWTLTKKQADEWVKLWEAASTSEKEVQRPLLLGYTGCRLQQDKHSYWLLYNGYVSFYTLAQMINKEDKVRQMEFFLLNTADKETKEALHNLKVI